LGDGESNQFGAIEANTGDLPSPLSGAPGAESGVSPEVASSDPAASGADFSSLARPDGAKADAPTSIGQASPSSEEADELGSVAAPPPQSKLTRLISALLQLASGAR
jgi:hypothetical protein